MTDTTVALIRKLDVDPEDDDALAQLWQWHADRHEHEKLASLVERIAARRTDPPRAADLLFRLGQMWADPLRRADRAVAMWERAIQRDPNHIEASRALGEIYVRSGRHASAAPLLERQLAHAASANERVGLLHDLLSIRERTNDLPGQIAALDELASLRPRERELKRQLAKLLVQRSRQPDATEQDKLRAARVLGTLAAQADAAQSVVLAEGALQLWPGEENAFAVLETSYERAGRNNELISRRIDFITANPESRIAGRVRKQLAAMYSRMKQPERAIEALVPIADHDIDAARTLASLYKDTGKHAERAALVKSHAAAFEPGRPGDALRQRIEALRAAGDHEAMLTAMRELLKLEPGDADALSELEPAARAAGDFAALRDLLRQSPRGEKLPPESKIARLREVALLSEYDLGDDGGAIEAWKQVLVESPEHAEGGSALERLYARTSRWNELLALLERRARASTDTAVRKRLWSRYLDVHRLHRDNPAEEAAILQRLFSDEPEDESLAFALVAARRRAGDVSGVTEVLRTLVDDASPENAALRWSLLAQHLEATHQADAALAAWHRVRTLEPDQSMAWEAEERLLESTGGHAHLLETLIAHAGHPVAAGKQAASLLEHAARVARTLGDEKRAATLLDQARRIQPGIDPLASVIDVLEEGTPPSEKLTVEAPAAASSVVAAAPATKPAPEAAPPSTANVPTELFEAAPAESPADDIETTAISLSNVPAEASADATMEAEAAEAPAPEPSTPARRSAFVQTQRNAAVTGADGKRTPPPEATTQQVQAPAVDDEITGPVTTISDPDEAHERPDDEPTNPGFQIHSDGTISSDPRVAAARAQHTPSAGVTRAASPANRPSSPPLPAAPPRTAPKTDPPAPMPPEVAARAHRKTDPPPPPAPQPERASDPPPVPAAAPLPSIIVDEGLLGESDIPIEIDDSTSIEARPQAERPSTPPQRLAPITERPPPPASPATDRPPPALRAPAVPPMLATPAVRVSAAPPGGPPPLFGNATPAAPPILGTAVPRGPVEPPSLFETPGRSPFAQTAVGSPFANVPVATPAAGSAPFANSPFANIPSRRVFARPMTQLFEQMRSGRR